MLVACSRCGRIHERGMCPIKKSRSYTAKSQTNEQRFRNTAQWKRKTAEIRHRDAGLCKMCLYEGIINNRDLSIHHIDPIKHDPERILDNNNLITLCREHHRQADANEIAKGVLFRLAITPPAKLLK